MFLIAAVNLRDLLKKGKVSEMSFMQAVQAIGMGFRIKWKDGYLAAHLNDVAVQCIGYFENDQFVAWWTPPLRAYCAKNFQLLKEDGDTKSE